jgi:membrane protease YdiL (CAAX protease family)
MRIVFPAYFEHAIAVLVGLVLPGTAALSSGRFKGKPLATPEKIRFYWAGSANLWFLALLVVGIWVLRDRPLAQLGLALPGWHRTAAVVGVVFVALLIADTWFEVRNAASRETARLHWRRNTPFMPETRGELAYYAILALSAAICEEVMFRGFLIRYLQTLFSASEIATPLAIALPGIAFGISHWSQGAWSVIKIVVLAGFFGTLFVLTSSLLVPMALHAAVDLGMGALGLWLLRPQESAAGALSREARPATTDCRPRLRGGGS